MPTRDECIDAAGYILALSDAAIAQMTPREQAEAAWHPGAVFSIDELEDLIRTRRGMPSAHRKGAELGALLERAYQHRLARPGGHNAVRRRAVEDPDEGRA